MKKFTFQMIILLIVIFGALYLGTSKNKDVPFIPQQVAQDQILINDQIRVNVEVADTPSKRQKGLGGRDSLASDSGMLFIFPEANTFQFWMKGLKFPLDLIWLRELKVVDIIKNAQSPSTSQTDENLPIYMPNQAVDMVLEVNSGFVDLNLIKVGDTIKIER